MQIYILLSVLVLSDSTDKIQFINKLYFYRLEVMHLDTIYLFFCGIPYDEPFVLYYWLPNKSLKGLEESNM